MMQTKEWLIQNRKIRNLTQLALANEIGVNIATVQNIEQGKRKGSEETWRKFEEGFAIIDTKRELESKIKD